MTIYSQDDWEIHPQNVETMLMLVQCWQADRAEWSKTGRAPDGTRWQPRWPLSAVETAGLVMFLASRRAKPEPTVAAAA